MSDSESHLALARMLADLLAERDLAEVEYEADGIRLRLSRAAAPVALAGPAAAPAPPAPAPVTAPSAEPDASHPGAVAAPTVGTVYLLPGPGSPPFVKVGDTVRKGQTLLIVEAMKVMNHIPAPRDGTVTRILVENEQPVEYGEILMIIE